MIQLFDVCDKCGGAMYQHGQQVTCDDCGATRPVSAWQCPQGCGCFTDGAVCENCDELGHCNGPDGVTG